MTTEITLNLVFLLKKTLVLKGCLSTLNLGRPTIIKNHGSSYQNFYKLNNKSKSVQTEYKNLIKEV